MQHLKQLEFGDFQIISYYNLRHICEALKNSLNHLQARIDLPQDDICRSSLKHSFQNLKVFRFEEFMVGEDGVRRRLNNGPLTQLCVRRLTKLQVVQDYVDGQSYPPPMNTDTCCGRSDLQQLSVEAETASEKLPLLFQKVTRLQVKWIGSNDTNIDSLLQFRHVSVLVLDNFSSNRMLDAFLLRYGGQLHTLSLRVGSESKLCLKFATVFKACPNLERLFLEGLEMTDTSVITVESFTSLKELRWSQKRGKKASILSVLSAPDLEQVTVDVSNVSVDELKVASLLASKKKIFGKLRTLRLTIGCCEQVGTTERDISQALEDLATNAYAHCRK
ncbi:uncharacterized protein LOC135948047 [Cloeon dipterum]|uniref:uncharacterized protein LOC135948047 n=1 Tax=Cloeon dipterum TaxID=197152 RepID=UPI00321F744F